MTGRVLILGATGRFGRHAAEAFWNAGWRVGLFDRAGGDLEAQARGQDVIVNGWNPPYQHWARDLPGLTERVIAAARVSGARVVIPGNVYVYGPKAPPVLGADTPHRAENPLGRQRIAMERAYRAAGVRTLILRAGDFLDTEASGNWFDKIMIARLSRGRFSYPGGLEAPHAFAFLPDMARATVALCALEHRLKPFEDLGFAGYTLTGNAIGAAVSRALGRELRVTPMPWAPLRALSPLWPMARHLCEMRYLWDMPHRIDGARFDALLPGFRPTPLDDALSQAIAHKVGPDQPVTRRAIPAFAK
ncbi:epimerase [Oceaniglobus trochenteri]|uniref:epimerase n=1 Tax=Oceaniglobus trochenteri TaxID=2763260 RepID=UPI001CFFED9A|nr:epimerase [Oceaniglobus trochenteri]